MAYIWLYVKNQIENFTILRDAVFIVVYIRVITPYVLWSPWSQERLWKLSPKQEKPNEEVNITNFRQLFKPLWKTLK